MKVVETPFMSGIGLILDSEFQLHIPIQPIYYFWHNVRILVLEQHRREKTKSQRNNNWYYTICFWAVM